MSQDVLLKVYGHIWPADALLQMALAAACATALPEDAEEPILSREGDLLRISFEGIYFPVDDCLEVLAHHLQPAHQGKLDVLDLEDWRLTRHVFSQGRIVQSSAPLNNVLDYSGH